MGRAIVTLLYLTGVTYLSHWISLWEFSGSVSRSLTILTSTLDVAVPPTPSSDEYIRTRRDWSKFQYQAPELDPADERVSVDTTICGQAPTFDMFWTLDAKQRSRLNEDKIIYNFFFKYMDQTETEDFRYLELGAFDGIEESNTRFFDVCLGREGLLIEPNPRVFPKLLNNRPNAHRMSYAASCSEQEEMADKTVGFWASAFTNAAQDESVNREAYVSNAQLRKEVPCGSLTPVLLDLFPDGHVNFFSLDTEGTEHLVLQHIDFTRITFDVIIAENLNAYCRANCESRDQAQAILLAAGYILDSDTVPRSDLYIHPLVQQRALRSVSSQKV
jgi:Methyltransferase FkbM domain